MIWIYMGPRNEPPPLPAFEVNTLPTAHIGKPNIMMEEANWLQNLEGDLDSNHLDWLHRRLKADSVKPKLGMRGFWNSDQRAPRLDIVATQYGAYYTAKRTLPEGDEWHRINQFIFPFHSMISGGIPSMIGLRSFVPVDDYHTMLISQGGRVDKPVGEQQMFGGPNAFDEVGGYIERTHDPRSYFLTKANKRNDYFRDLSIEKESMSNGVPFVMNLQDRAMTELMCDADGNPIYDRTQEHLGSSDQMVIAVRRQLLQATLRLQDGGSPPANVDNVRLDRVRSATLRLPVDADWKTISEAVRDADSGRPPAADLPLIS